VIEYAHVSCTQSNCDNELRLFVMYQFNYLSNYLLSFPACLQFLGKVSRNLCVVRKPIL